MEGDVSPDHLDEVKPRLDLCDRSPAMARPPGSGRRTSGDACPSRPADRGAGLESLIRRRGRQAPILLGLGRGVFGAGGLELELELLDQVLPCVQTLPRSAAAVRSRYAARGSAPSGRAVPRRVRVDRARSSRRHRGVAHSNRFDHRPAATVDCSGLRLRAPRQGAVRPCRARTRHSAAGGGGTVPGSRRASVRPVAVPRPRCVDPAIGARALVGPGLVMRRRRRVEVAALTAQRALDAEIAEADEEMHTVRTLLAARGHVACLDASKAGYRAADRKPSRHLLHGKYGSAPEVVVVAAGMGVCGQDITMKSRRNGIPRG